MIDLEKARNSFDKFVSSYDMSNRMIKLKYYHTYRVCEQSIAICKSLNLSKEDTDIAYLIALLHDIGRFEQGTRFGTFDDSKSMDHADFGCQLLFEEGLIRNFIDDDKYDEIIRKSIFNHNKYSISSSLNERELMHAKIIRDADKIDIIHNIVNIGEIKLNEDYCEISDEVKEDFYNERQVYNFHNHSKNDAVITRFAFVFDLNFKYSYKYFKENDFIDKMYDKLKNKSMFEEYINKLNKYIERKCNDVRN